MVRLFHREPELSLAEWDARENVKSIEAVPLDVLPDGPARREAIRLAESGAEVYAYRPAASEWVIWHFQGNPQAECRRSPSEWASWWGVALRDGGH